MSISQEIQKKKKSKLIRRIIYVLVFVSIIGVLAYYFMQDSSKQEVQKDFYTVGTGNLETYVSGDGNIVSGKKIELNFSVAGEIKNIYKKESDTVTKGEKIADLENKKQNLNVDRANIDLRNAYAVLEEKKEVKGLEVFKTDLDLSSITLSNTLINSKNDLDVAQNNYDMLKVKLTNMANDLVIEKNNLGLIDVDEDKKISHLENILSLKANVIILDVEKFLGEVDEFLGVTNLNKDKNDDFEDLIGARDVSLKKKAENLFRELNTSFSSNKDTKNIYDYKHKLKTLLETVIDVLDNTIDSVAITNSDINTLKLKYRGYLSTLEIDYQDYILGKQSLDYEKTNKDILKKKQVNLISTLVGDIELTKKDLEYSLDNLDNTKKLIKNTIDLAEKQKEKSSEQYMDKSSGLTDKELQPYNIAIDEARNNLAKAQNDLNDTILTSPVDGTILDINYKVGEYYMRGEKPFGILIAEDNQYIESYMEQRDIADIRLGQSVNVSLDAFDNLSFTGVVDYVSSKGERDKSDIIVYKVLISSDTDNPKVKDSMSANLDFLKDSVKDGIIIPSKYIFYEDGIPKVMKLDESIVTIKEGISDGEYVHVVEGLEVGDRVVEK